MNRKASGRRSVRNQPPPPPTHAPRRPAEQPRSLREFQAMFADEAACADYMERIRWPDGFICPSCGVHVAPWRISTRPDVLRCTSCRHETLVFADAARHTRGPGAAETDQRVRGAHSPTRPWVVRVWQPDRHGSEYVRQLARSLNICHASIVLYSMSNGNMVDNDDSGWTVTYREVDTTSWSSPYAAYSEADAVTKVGEWLVSRGTLARMARDGSPERLFVMDGAKPCDVTRDGVSVAAWESDSASAESMMAACEGVDNRRLVDATCEIAESSIKYMTKGMELARNTIDVARRHANSTASAEDVERIGGECYRFAQFASSFGCFARDVGASGASASPISSAAAALAAVGAAKVSLSNDTIDSCVMTVKFATESAGQRKDDTASFAAIVRRHVPLHVVALASVL